MVPEFLDKSDHFLDLLLLLIGEFPSFLDQPAHMDDLHTLVLRKPLALVRPSEQVEPLCTVERDILTVNGCSVAGIHRGILIVVRIILTDIFTGTRSVGSGGNTVLKKAFMMIRATRH